MAESFSERLRRYLRETKQRLEQLAAKVDLPPQVLQRLLYVEEEESPPQYILDRLTKVTGVSWGGTAAANESFERALPAGSDFSSAFFRTSSRSSERAVNPFHEDPSMAPKKSESDRPSIHDLFRDAPVKASAPEPTNDERDEFLREHIRIAADHFGSAAALGRLVGTTSVTVRNWIKRYKPKENYLKPIALALGVTQNALFEPPTEEFLIRMGLPAGKRSEMKNAEVIDNSAPAPEETVSVKRPIDELFSSVSSSALEEPLTEDEPVSEKPEESAEPISEPETEAPAAVSSAPESEPSSERATINPAATTDPEPEPDPVPAAPGTEQKPSPVKKEKFKSQDQGFGSDIADLIPDGSASQSLLSDRLTQWMNEKEMSLGDVTAYMPRRLKDIYRLQSLVLGRAAPKPREAAILSGLIGISVEQLLIEAQLPGAKIRAMPEFETVCRNAGIFPAAPQTSETLPEDEQVTETPAPTKDDEPVPVPVPEKETVPAEPESIPEPGLPEGVHRTEALQCTGRPRGISAIEFGSGTLDFATDGSPALIYTITGREFEPVFKPETAIIIRTDGYDPEVPVRPSDLPKKTWYLLKAGKGVTLRLIDPADDADNNPISVIGISSACIKAKLL